MIEIQHPSTLVHEPKAVDAHKRLQPEVEQVNADRDAHYARVHELRSRSSDDLTAADTAAAQALKVEEFHLKRREVAVRKRLLKEWHPLVLANEAEALREAHRQADEAEKKLERDVREGLIKVGFDPEHQVQTFSWAMNSHPGLRAAREATSAAENAAQRGVPELRRFMEAEATAIAAEEASIAELRRQIVPV